ncbi:ankyrin repeat-containing protein At2g01680 [Fagus crenata]
MVNVDKDTALHCATRNGHYQSVKLLIEADPELSNLTNNAYESTYLATSRDFRDIAELILNASPSSSSHVGPNGITALHAAVSSERQSNHFTLFKPLIFRSISRAVLFTGSKEAFLQPKVSTEKEFMEILLEKKPNIIRERESWMDSTSLCCFWGLAELVRQFLNHDSFVAYVLDNDGESALHIAAYYGEINSIKEMIKSCPDICDLTNHKGQTALHLAILGGEGCQYILETQSIEPDKDETPFAYWGFRAERVRCLLKDNIGIQGLQQRISTSNLKQPPVDERSSSSLNTKDMDNSDKLDFRKRNKLETNLLVAMLVATVSFAAAFTTPGGYKSDGPDQGLANLTEKVAFKAFVIFDTIAFLFSILAVRLQLNTSQSYTAQIRYMKLAGMCTYISIVGMVLAFVSGMHVVLAKSIGLLITADVMGGCLMLSYRVVGFMDPTMRTGLPCIKRYRRYVLHLLFHYGVI